MNFLKKYWPILIIFLLSLTPLLWFQDGLVIAGGDESIFLNPGSMMKSTFWAWNPIFNGGNPVGDYQGNVAQLFPFIMFWYAGLKVGLSLITIEKLWFIITWFITGCGIYYLCQVLVKNKSQANLMSVFAVSVYLFNIYIMQYILMYTVRLPIMIMPWTLAFMIRGLEFPEKKIKYAILFALFALLGASGWVNPPAAVIIILVPFIYWILFIIYKKEIKNPITFLGLIILFFTLFNLYWLYPFVLNLFKSISGIKDSGTSIFFNTSSLFDTLRFLGSWSFRALSNKIEYVPLNQLYYNNLLTIIASYSIIGISLVGLFFFNKIKENKKIIFFLLIAVIGLFLVKGPQEPFKSISMFLYEHVPGFWVFREPYAKFMSIVTLGIAILFGYSLFFIINSLQKIYKSYFIPITIGLIAITIVIVASIPLPMGQTIWQYTDGPARSYHAKIPQYWSQMGDYISSENPDDTVLVLPKNGSNSTTYNWESGFTLKGSVANYFIKNPYFYYQHVPIYFGEKMVREIYDEILAKNDSDLAQKLGFFGIKYLLTQRDIDWEYNTSGKISDSREVNSFVETKNNISKSISYDKLDLFEINDSSILPKVSIGQYPSCTETLENLEKQTVSILDASSIQENDIFLISSDNICPTDTNFSKKFTIGDENTNIEGNDLIIDLNVEKKDKYFLVFSKSEKNNENINYYLDNVKISSDKIKTAKNKGFIFYQIDLGLLSLGKHNIVFKSVAKPINIGDGSFENIYKSEKDVFSNNWQLVDISNNNSDISAQISTDAADGKNSLKIFANNTVGALKNNISIQEEDDYHLGFYYKNYGNYPASYVIEFIGNDGKVKKSISNSLPISGEWKKIDIYFKAESDNINLYFNNHSQNSNQAIGIDGVKLDQISITPNSIVINDGKNSIIDKAEFTKINPTKYLATIDASNQFYLNLMESFDEDWVVYEKDSNKLLSTEENHYVLNGFANSWKIDKTGSYEIVIEYKRQKTLTILYIVSIISIILGIIYVAKKRR